MQIIDVIPATKIPRSLLQVYTYYTSKKLKLGSLVLAPLYHRRVKAIVINIRKFNKLEIKKYDFALKNIIKILEYQPVLNQDQLKLAKWISEYYYEPLSLVIKILCPK